MKKKKTLGIAFGGGGARGMVHLGIMQVLNDFGIRPDFISGTSMGSLMGAGIACGISPNELQVRISEFGKEKLMKFRNFNIFNESLVKSDNIEIALENLFGDKTFDDCLIPFRTCATDIESGELVVMKHGLLKTALRASSAIPLILPPVFYEGKVLVDGGVVSNVPLELLEEFKPDVTLGIKVDQFASRQDIAVAIFKHYYAPHYKGFLGSVNFLKKIKDNMKLITGIVLRSLEIATSQSTKQRIEKAKPDVLLTPSIDIGILEFDRVDEVVEIGRKLMQENLPKLLKLLDIDIPKMHGPKKEYCEDPNELSDSD